MATKEKIDDGYVEYGPIFEDGERYKGPINVIINGKKYSVPRGKKLKLPKVVAEVLDQSFAQEAYAAKVDRDAQKEQILQM